MTKRRRLYLFTLCGVTLLVLGVLQRQLAAQETSRKARPLREMASEVARDVGTVGTISETANRGTVVVFEEFHTSRVGQLQIALMLLRLHEKYGVRKVGLEGAMQSAGVLDAGWFRKAGGDSAKDAREDVAVRMLAEGEISEAEFMAMLFSDVQVFGTEVASLYDTELSSKGNPSIDYLLAIAEKGLSQDDIRQVNSLIARKQQKQALEYMLNANPWTRHQYEAITASSSDTAGSQSLEAMKHRLVTIQAKAAEVGATVEAATRADAAAEMRFLDAGIRRSEVMTKHLLTEANAEQPVAMIIGAAHTEGVIAQLRAQGVSYVLLTPKALNPKYGSLSTEQFDRKNKGRWSRISPGTLGRLLNPAPPATHTKAEIRKPPPIIGTASAKSYANATLAGMLIAIAARDKKRVPEDVWDQIKALPEVAMNRPSFAVMGDDVVFSMILTRTDGTKTTVWARVGSADTPAAARQLEGKLLQAAADLGGNDAIPPTKPPSGTTSAKDEGPGDGKREKVVVSRTGLRTLAVYGATRNSVVSVGKVSG